MKYKLGDLVRDYIDNLISRDGLEYQIKTAQLKNESIDNLVKEKELYDKKVDVVDRLFKCDDKVPVGEWLSYKIYKTVKCIYIDNIKDRFKIAEILNTTKNAIDQRIYRGMKKLDNIEIEI